MKESEIRDQIVEYLRKKGVMVWKDRQVTTRPGRGTFRTSNGVPDIIGIAKDGRFIGIEVKTRTGKLSDAQIAFMERAGQTKAILILARDLKDVISYFIKEKAI